MSNKQFIALIIAILSIGTALTFSLNNLIQRAQREFGSVEYQTIWKGDIWCIAPATTTAAFVERFQDTVIHGTSTVSNVITQIVPANSGRDSLYVTATNNIPFSCFLTSTSTTVRTSSTSTATSTLQLNSAIRVDAIGLTTSTRTYFDLKDF